MSIEKSIYQDIYERLDPDAVVVDIGAYLGNTSNKICDQIQGKPNNFYMIEACPVNFSEMKKTYGHVGFNLYNLAISDQDGETEIYSANHPNLSGSSQSNSLYRQFVEDKKWADSVNKHRVSTMTLDSFVKLANLAYIDLLKINCEGGEYKILDDRPKALDNTKLIYLQLHRKCAEFLTRQMEDKRRAIMDTLSGDFDIILSDVGQSRGHLHILYGAKS